MKNQKIEVVSRYGGMISIKESNTGIVRTWPKCGAKLYLTEDSLLNLSMTPGARKLIQDYLIIKNDEVLEELEVDVELEYHYEVKEVTDLLMNGSEEELIDALNLAPKGVVDLIKKVAIEIQLPNMNKRKIIDKMLQVDISKMIEVAHTESSDVAEKPKVRERLAQQKEAVRETRQEKAGKSGRKAKPKPAVEEVSED